MIKIEFEFGAFMNVIPVMHCFDNNYVLPACISFYSMLEHADTNYFYKLYVVSNDITEENKQKLFDIVAKFPNASLEFINIDYDFSKLFKKTKNQAHYSKEIYYKFIPARIFTQYEKIIITDVDVVFLGDISKDFVEFDINEDYYLAGVQTLYRRDEYLSKDYKLLKKHYSNQEIDKLLTGAGYWIYNLKKMREDNMPEKFIEFAQKNSKKIVYPEQDTVNLVCYPKIKLLHPKAMVCNHHYRFYQNENDYKLDNFYPADIVKEALENPIQLHYAGQKPWTGELTKGRVWLEYVYKLNLIDEYIDLLSKAFKKDKKTILSFKMPFTKNKIFLMKSVKGKK
ncbi:MAG: glycosyltransferase family 8 protein [Cyanobacteria bacterium SIG29]|nr:glycosyltransferase family 8 protein [Cyanobacteria bacterium SIG29]